MKRVTIAVCDKCGFENSKDNFCENCNKEIQWSTFVEEAEYKQVAAELAELQAVKAERDELFSVTVKAFDAMFEIGVGIAPEELTPRVRALDHALANDLNDELWERINSAALAKGAK